jgi:hypothetical protein
MKRLSRPLMLAGTPLVCEASFVAYDVNTCKEGY